MAKYQRPRLFYRELYVISSPYSCPSNHNLKLANPALRLGFQEALLKTSFYSPVIANFRKIELPSVFCQRNLFLKIIRLDNRTKWRNDKKFKKKKNRQTSWYNAAFQLQSGVLLLGVFQMNVSFLFGGSRTNTSSHRNQFILESLSGQER